jgi:hypothetical protein
MLGGLAADGLRREVMQIERVADWRIGGEVWRLLCIYMGRCPRGQINRGGNKMAKKTLKKSKKIEATKPLLHLAINGKK